MRGRASPGRCAPSRWRTPPDGVLWGPHGSRCSWPRTSWRTCPHRAAGRSLWRTSARTCPRRGAPKVPWAYVLAHMSASCRPEGPLGVRLGAHVRIVAPRRPVGVRLRAHVRIVASREPVRWCCERRRFAVDPTEAPIWPVGHQRLDGPLARHTAVALWACVLVVLVVLVEGGCRGPAVISWPVCQASDHTSGAGDSTRGPLTALTCTVARE
jgi:hypothetical protein